MLSKRPKIFIISAPSGCGKTTLCKRLLRAVPNLVHSVSVTTRPRRGGERGGKDYYFVSKSKFQKLIKQGKFLEWTRTYGWYYGTLKKSLKDLLRKGKYILVSIDVKGAINVKRLYPQKSVLVFIAPPSVKELRQRLKRRNLDKKKEIEKRIRIARRELSYINRYDYCVVNEKISLALCRLKAIVTAERYKVR